MLMRSNRKEDDRMSTREKAVEALAATVERKDSFESGYANEPEANVLATVGATQRQRALKQLGDGDGAELKGSDAGKKPHFHAAHSSSALALNSFAAWIDSEHELRVDGEGGFEAIQFERKFPTGLHGTPPNLDVYLSRARNPIAIESKCTEFLAVHKAKFAESYRQRFDEVAEEDGDSPLPGLYRELDEDPGMFRHLDAAQLVKHALGLWNAKQNGQSDQYLLLYLYWEPTDAGEYTEFRNHRKDVAEFAAAMEGDKTIHFRSMSYLDLWDEWASRDLHPGLDAHLRALRSRYAVSLA